MTKTCANYNETDKLERDINNAMKSLGEVLIQQVILLQDGKIDADVQLSIRGGGLRSIQLNYSAGCNIEIYKKPDKK